MLFAKVGVGQLYFLNENISSTQIEFCFDKINPSGNLFYVSASNSQIYNFFIVQYSSNGIDNWTNITGIDDLIYSTIVNSDNKKINLDNLKGNRRISNFYRAIFSSTESNLSSNNVESSIAANTAIISAVLKVIVNPNTSITTQPAGYSVCAGGSSTALSVVATGTGDSPPNAPPIAGRWSLGTADKTPSIADFLEAAFCAKTSGESFGWGK